MSAVISPLAVLPEQFFNLSLSQEKGEAALMYAVLEDAVNCFMKQFTESGRPARRLAQEAEEWFFSDDEGWPFSFANVCTVLELDPDYVRKGLQQWSRKRPTQFRQIRHHGIRRVGRPKAAA